MEGGLGGSLASETPYSVKLGFMVFPTQLIQESLHHNPVPSGIDSKEICIICNHGRCEHVAKTCLMTVIFKNGEYYSLIMQHEQFPLNTAEAIKENSPSDEALKLLDGLAQFGQTRRSGNQSQRSTPTGSSTSGNMEFEGYTFQQGYVVLPNELIRAAVEDSPEPAFIDSSEICLICKQRRCEHLGMKLHMAVILRNERYCSITLQDLFSLCKTQVFSISRSPVEVPPPNSAEQPELNPSSAAAQPRISQSNSPPLPQESNSASSSSSAASSMATTRLYRFYWKSYFQLNLGVMNQSDLSRVAWNPRPAGYPISAAEYLAGVAPPGLGTSRSHPAAAKASKTRSEPSTLQAISGRLAGTKFCRFCFSNRESRDRYMCHDLYTEEGAVICPVLYQYKCPICQATGSVAHTEKYCPNNLDTTATKKVVHSATGKFYVKRY